MKPYAIYKVIFPGGDFTLDYGKRPGENREGRSYEILDEYEIYKLCSSEFHASERSLTRMRDILSRLKHQGAPADIVVMTAGIVEGVGWPTTPYLENVFQREQAVRMILAEWDVERERQRVRQAATLVQIPRTGLTKRQTRHKQSLHDAGVIASIGRPPEEVEAIRAELRRYGVDPLF